jgi:hypothetical protein
MVPDFAVLFHIYAWRRRIWVIYGVMSYGLSVANVLTLYV